MQIFLARTQGFCAGVARAIETVELALRTYGTPLYIYHEIVHNTAVVQSFTARGVVFVDDLDAIPDRSRVIFSAHGVPPSIVERAKAKGLDTIDATCPLVTKVHAEAVKFSQKGMDVIMIGHKGHEEVTGTSGYVSPELLHIVQKKEDIEELDIPAHKTIAFMTQTTLSVDETREIILKLRARYPRLLGPTKDNICYATQNRQDSIKELAQTCDLIIICGSPNSSNSNRLREKGEQLGIASHIIDNADQLDIRWLDNKENIGISSGASVPRHIVDELIHKIQKQFPSVTTTTFENPERNILFPLPKI